MGAGGKTHLVGGKFRRVESGLFPPPPTGVRARNRSTRRGPHLWKGVLKRGLGDNSAQQGHDEQRTLLSTSSNKHSERVPGAMRFKKG
jgi:hypothetical protein